MLNRIEMVSLDDNTVTNDLDRSGYRAMGVFVKRISAYDELVKALKSSNVDIVVINLDYSRVDGLSVVKALKTPSGEFSNVPVVATSVKGDAATRKNAISAGADLFVEQPVPRQLFIEKLKKILEKSTRDNTRIDIRGARATVDVDNSKVSCSIEDLSLTGLLLATDHPMADGKEVGLEFLVPGYKRAIRVKGQVVRTVKIKGATSPSLENSSHSGVGIRFKELKGEAQKKIEKFIEKTSNNDPQLAYYL